ncbi:MAG TPA: YkvA family protein [Desulfosporosinus sp.]|nr:YkvA family protein [Desulfosporosinus sp.]
MDKLENERLDPYKGKASQYLQDKKKSLGLLNEALQKATARRGALGETWDKLQLLFAVFRDWIHGSYKEMPKRSLLMIILGIIYFVSPLDAIFDYIPFAGLVDDAAVAGFVISQVSEDLERYKLWKRHTESEKEGDDVEKNTL